MNDAKIQAEGRAIIADEAKITRTEIAMRNATPKQRATKYAKVMNHLTVARFNLNQRKQRFLEKIGVN